MVCWFFPYFSVSTAGCSKDLTPTPDGGGPSFWNSMTIGGASGRKIQLKDVPWMMFDVLALLMVIIGLKYVEWPFCRYQITFQKSTVGPTLPWWFKFDLMIGSSSKNKGTTPWNAVPSDASLSGPDPLVSAEGKLHPKSQGPTSINAPLDPLCLLANMKAMKAWHAKFHRMFEFHIFILIAHKIHMIPHDSVWMVWLAIFIHLHCTW